MLSTYEIKNIRRNTYKKNKKTCRGSRFVLKCWPSAGGAGGRRKVAVSEPNPAGSIVAHSWMVFMYA